MKTIPIGPFLGINNRLPDFSLSIADKGSYVRAADNVEISNAGTVYSRKVPELIQAITGAHSLFNDLYVRASVLYRATFSPFAETLVKVLTGNDRMSYCVINGDTYYSNGTDSGRIAANGTVYPWALPTPSAPAVAPIGGSLFKGKYQVAVGYTNATTGEEGGVSASTNYELSADGGLRITLPSATTGATHINVYVSTVNGSIPMLQTTVATGTTTVDVTAHAAGREANQRYEAPLPAGTRLFEFNGRLCSVKGNDLFYSLPYRHGYYLPVEGRIAFPEDVSIAIGNQSGVFVAADKTYFFSGQDLGAVDVVRDLLPYGAVPGTEFIVPNDTTVGWFGEKGIVLAAPDGQAVAVMADSIDLTPPASGFSIVLETRGYRRVVSCGWCLNLETKAATTYSSWGITSASGDYGTKADGIYALEGEGKVDAYADLGKVNFGTENLKHLPACYATVASEAPVMLRVTTPDGDEYDYLARDCDPALRVQRIDPGKGLRENYYGLKLMNTEGSDFTLASVSFAPVASGRRI
jgi:hypothetical protein